MSYCHSPNLTSPATVTARLRELAKAAESAVVCPSPRYDPDDVIGPLEACLDLIAEALDGDPIECAACHEPMAAFRVCDWTYVDHGTLCTDHLCSSCFSAREDEQDTILYYTESHLHV